MGDRVRTIDASEIDSWVSQMGVGFLFEVADGFGDYFLGDVDLERTWGAFDGESVVGTLRSFATAFTVPGPAQVTAAALTNVTVAPTHRRRGLLSEMLEEDLRGCRERGEPVGILIASEYPIYGRFGYGRAIDAAGYSVDATSARFRVSAPGRMELVDRESLRAEAPAVYERFRTQQTGSIERLDRWWDRHLHQVDVPGAAAPKGYCALYRSPHGEVEGYVRYEASEEWDDMRPKGTLTVEELVSTTPASYAGLWQYCCEVDLLTSVRASNRSVVETLPWLLDDARAVRQSSSFDFVWVRVLDVCQALSARTYSTESRVVIEVTDPLGFANGRYALEGGATGAGCKRTSEAPDLTLPVDALGSIYAGGFSLQTLRQAGRVAEHREGAVEHADLMFKTSTAPWCNTWF